MIVAENISKSYGGQELFDSVSFRINSHERLGLVGRNGHGKTTLFRIVTGEEQPDDGRIIIPKNYRLGYLQQRIVFSESSVVAEASTALAPEERINTWKAEKVLSGLGFSRAQMEGHPGELSGGYQVRLCLSKVLISEPNLLLLDEPNNYLDITSIRWLLRFLISWPGELMLITHDRGFMDSVVTHTMAIHRRKVRKIEGDTGKLYAQIAQEEEIYEQTRVNDEKRRREIELFVNRFRAKARLGNLVQSRVKMLEKMEIKERLSEVKTLEFSFVYHHTHSKYLLTAQDLTFGYDKADRPLVQGLSISVGAQDRICVIGKNGKGKTTLLKLLAGALAPDAGEVTRQQNTAMGYYEQSNIQSLAPTNTVLDEITFAHESADRQLARNISGAMMFEGDDALKKVEVLSGGEKSRVMLGKLLVTPLNLLLLDEPTNHLDMESCDSLLSALDNFPGAIVMVTHNEMYLHALATRLIVFQDEKPFLFEGSYQRFLEKIGWADDTAPQSGPSPAEGAPRSDRKEARRKRSEIIAERSRVMKPLEARIKEVEALIESTEKELERLHDEMIAASQAGEGKKIASLSQDIHRCQTAIDALFGELEPLITDQEEHTRRFEAMLAGLE